MEKVLWLCEFAELVNDLSEGDVCGKIHIRHRQNGKFQLAPNEKIIADLGYHAIVVDIMEHMEHMW